MTDVREFVNCPSCGELVTVQLNETGSPVDATCGHCLTDVPAALATEEAHAHVTCSVCRQAARADSVDDNDVCVTCVVLERS